MTTHVEYNIDISEDLVRSTQHGCNNNRLLHGFLTDLQDSSELYFSIPCFESSSSVASFDEYLRYHLRWLLSALPQGCALEFVTRVLIPANASHRCSATARFTSSYFVRFEFRRLPTRIHDDDAALNRAILDSFNMVVPKTKPALPSSILDLISDRTQKQISEGDMFERDWSDHDCSICLDEIEKRAESLTLPCSHVFHQSCLQKWFDNDHVCPLCRFEMPTA